MTFLSEVTPAFYRLESLLIKRDGEGGVTATFEFALYSEAGQGIAHHKWSATLTSGEQDTLTTFVTSHLTEFETETGLTRLSS
jgi:hypothetical protein